MKKLLFFTIILFAFSFAKDEVHLFDGTIKYGKYIGISGNEVFFKIDDYYYLEAFKVSKIDYLMIDNNKISNSAFVVINRNNTNIKDEISKAGLLLDSFRDKYYQGMLINTFGAGLMIFGSGTQNPVFYYIGWGVSIVGWTITFLSFSDIGDAGEILNNVN